MSWCDFGYLAAFLLVIGFIVYQVVLGVFAFDSSTEEWAEDAINDLRNRVNDLEDAQKSRKK